MAALCNGEVQEAGDSRGRGRVRCSSPRTVPRALVVVFVCALFGSLALGSVPALAIGQRGHVFSFSFGESGSGSGQLSSPQGLAVNDATGNVYVADTANNRVEEFEPVTEGGVAKAKFVRSFEVLNPEVIAIDNSPSSPSKGDVYVGGTSKKAIKEEEPEDKLVYKFDETGTLITKFKKFKEEKGGESEEFAAIEGIAVDPSGTVFIYDEEGVIADFNNAVKNKSKFSLESEFTSAATRGIAANSKGELYLGHAAQQGKPPPPLIGQCHIVAVECETTVAALDEELSTAVAVNPVSEPANLVSEQDDAYITNVGVIHGKTVTSIVAFNSSGAAIQRFGESHVTEGTGVAVDSHSGVVYVSDAASNKVDAYALEPAGPPKIAGLSSCSTLCTSEEGVTKISAQVNPEGSETHAFFTYCPASGGSCTSTQEKPLGEGFGDQTLSEELRLPPGTYRYKAIAKNAHGEVSSAERTFTIVSAGSLLPDARAWEMVSPPNKDGAEAEAISQEGGAIEAARNGNAITYVADGPIPAESQPEGNRNPELSQILSVRAAGAWESQDLATKHSHGSGIEVGIPREYQQFTPNLALGLVEPFAGGSNSSPLAEPPLSPAEQTLEGGTLTEKTQEKTIYVHDNSAIAPEAAERASWEVAKLNGEKMRNLGYVALVTEFNAPGHEPFGGGGHGVGPTGIEVLSGTADLSHVVLKSFKAAPGLYEWGPGSEASTKPLLGSLLGSLEAVSVLPEAEGGGAEPNADLGNLGSADERNAISTDGSRVIWTGDQKKHLYMRDMRAHQTVRLDTPQIKERPGELPSPSFQVASADGSKVFFTDAQRLTSDSKAESEKAEPDLYVYETPAGKPPRLTDLTPEGVRGEPADVLVNSNTGGGVLGASEDGSYVYFVANGALPEGEEESAATRGSCTTEQKRAPGATCNLYVRHYDATSETWEAPKLIAALSDQDAGDWGGFSGVPGDPSWMTSRVSPNGQYLAFMSQQSLTGYNNEDKTSKAKGERLDEEVFLYHAGAETLVCASCNPSGARPAGVFDGGANGQGGSGEGVGLVADRKQIWGELDSKADHWLAGSVPGWTTLSVSRGLYQSRYLSDQGRLFFNSPDELVPATKNTTKEKVYEYEANGVGGCTGEGGCVGLISAPSSGSEAEHESAFLDASENGNDVFFLSAAKLVPQDIDTNFDVYDARVCSAQDPEHSTCLTPPPAPPPPCQEEGCKGSAPTAPSFSAPASATVLASGNVPKGGALPTKVTVPPAHLTRAQLLNKALKTCRTKYHSKRKKKQRVQCEKRARKRYAHAAKRHVAKKASAGRAR
jgi:DNA-binding beta-propeller fold protein YncE